MTTRVSSLSNGLTIVTSSIPGLETTSIGIWVKVGTRNEPLHLNGVSHFLEHMAFKGTTTSTAQDIVEKIEAVGGHLNAYTTRETTAYYARTLGEHVPIAIDILADILQNSIFSEEEIERERAVIIQEIGQTYDTPDDIIFDYFQATAFPGQPLGYPILGPTDTIRALKRDDIKGYMDTTYGASRMVLVASGKIDHDFLVKLAEEKFISLPMHSDCKAVSAQYKGGEFRQHRPLEQVHVAIGFPSAKAGSNDAYAASMLSTLLGGGMSSRLFQEIREKRGLVYSIGSFCSSYQDTGLFTIYAGTGEETVMELIPVLASELKKLPHTLTDYEILRTKNQLKAGLMMALESPSARCEQLAAQMMTYGRPLSTDEIKNRIDAITKDDLQHLAHQIFSADPTVASLGPIENIDPFSAFVQTLRD